MKYQCIICKDLYDSGGNSYPNDNQTHEQGACSMCLHHRIEDIEEVLKSIRDDFHVDLDNCSLRLQLANIVEQLQNGANELVKLTE